MFIIVYQFTLMFFAEGKNVSDLFPIRVNHREDRAFQPWQRDRKLWIQTRCILFKADVVSHPVRDEEMA